MASPTYTSPTNSFSIYWVYNCSAPSYTPDDDFSLEDVADNTNFEHSSSSPGTAPLLIPGPFGISPSTHMSADNPNSLCFENPSVLRLTLWYHNGSSSKSLNDLNNLVHNVICSPNFHVEHFDNFDATRAIDRLLDQGGGASGTSATEMPLNDGWRKSSVPISLACDKVLHKSEDAAPTLHVTGLYHHKPLDIIKAALREPNAQHFHLAPFEEYWIPQLGGLPECIYSDIYNSDVYLQEQAIVHSQTHRDGDPLETVIVLMMLWSDSTHLTSFGNVSLWPIYLFFGNQSKYDRAKPTTFLAHHLVYIPEVIVIKTCCFIPSADTTSCQA